MIGIIKKIFYWFLGSISLLLSLFSACASSICHDQTTTKGFLNNRGQIVNLPVDTTTEATVPVEGFTEVVNDSIFLHVLSLADSITAYTFEEWKYDSTAFAGYKTIQCIEQLDSAQRQPLMETLGNPQNYLISANTKLCEFFPQIGFPFRNCIEHTVLIAMHYNMIRFDDSALLEIDPGHAVFKRLHRYLFPTIQEDYIIFLKEKNDII